MMEELTPGIFVGDHANTSRFLNKNFLVGPFLGQKVSNNSKK